MLWEERGEGSRESKGGMLWEERDEGSRESKRKGGMLWEERDEGSRESERKGGMLWEERGEGSRESKRKGVMFWEERPRSGTQGMGLFSFKMYKNQGRPISRTKMFNQKNKKQKQKKAGMIERLQTNELAWQCAPERFGLLTAMFNYNMASLAVKDVDRSRQF